MRAIPCLLLFSVVLFGQTLPRFEDFPTAEAFKSGEEPPNKVTRDPKLLRNIFGLDASRGPNFAGQLTVATLSCGFTCLFITVIDPVGSTLYPAPFPIILANLLPNALFDGKRVSWEDHPPIAFRLTSRLLIVRGCPDENLDACASYFYEWTGKEFKLIRKIPAKRLAELQR